MIGETIRRARFAHGLSLGALAEAAGVHKSTLSRWESGKSVPYAEELERVFSVLEVPQDTRTACWKALGVPRAARQLSTQEQAVTNGELLRALRLRAQLSQEDTARAIGIAQATLSDWENDYAWPTAENLARLCQALEATPKEEAGLLARDWQTQGNLPLDREALDAYLQSLVNQDTLLERSLLYLAVAGRYWKLFRSGYISEAETCAPWGFYANHVYRLSGESMHAPNVLLEQLAIRVAQPCYATISQTRGPLTWGQARAFTSTTDLTISTRENRLEGSRRKRELQQALLPRVPKEMRSFWLDNLSMSSWHLRDHTLFDAYSEASIAEAQTESESNMRRQRYARLLCWRDRFDDALAQLQRSAEGPTDSRLHIIVERELIACWALLETSDRHGARHHLDRASHILKENPAFYDRGTQQKMAEDLCLRLAA